jgi:uncharacterized NAD(P)/FAD-binding protein YdhS
MNDAYDIAIAGAGFSGLMVLANIMRGKGRKPRVFWTDPAMEWGFGLAYSTYESCHLLNVRADRMGAFADGIDDFWRWLQKHYPGRFQAEDFVPRMIYGEYLGTIRDRFDDVPLESARITGARREGDLWVLQTKKRQVTAKTLVLATGNPPIAPLGWPNDRRFVPDFWRWRLEGGSAGALPPDATIVIAGAGLTTADAILGLLQDGFKGRIVCVSPHGRMPEPHATVGSYERAGQLETEMKAVASCMNYIRTLRRHARNDDWRAVIDALRTYTVPLWQALPDKEKARFMRHLWSRWNIRRHRMAPQISSTIEASGQMEIVAGRIVETKETGLVTIQPRHGGVARTIDAALVLNCTGPSYRKMVADNPLLKSLMEQGYIAPGPLRLGIAVPETPELYAVGTPLLGERFETTAVPDLRGQAAEIAKILRG